jgi:hypothetical protein
LSHTVVDDGLRGIVLTTDTKEFIHDFSVQQMQ